MAVWKPQVVSIKGAAGCLIERGNGEPFWCVLKRPELAFAAPTNHQGKQLSEGKICFNSRF